MKEYIKLFETPESGNGFKINDIPWIATVKTTGQNLLCNEHNRKTVNNDGTLEITEGDTIFYLLDGTEIIFTGDTISSEDISEYRDDIVSIELCRTTKNIGIQAFATCQSLTSVTIGEGITNLTFGVFANCPNLINVKLPDSLIALDGDQFLGGGVFQGCTSLKNIKLGNNLEYIGKRIFYNCTSLESIKLPNSLDTIYEGAFENCESLREITFPTSLKTIKSTAFLGCTNLQTVKFNDSISELGYDIFSGCTSLPILNGARYADDKYLIEVVNKTRSHYEILDTTKWIEKRAFNEYVSLEIITIPSSVVKIGSDAFYGCVSLSDVHINDIAAWCNIEFVNDGSTPFCQARNLYLNNELVINLVIPNCITEIKAYTFRYCISIETVEIPGSVTSIGNDAFHGCSNLKSIIIPNNVTKIGSSAFAYCSGLTSVEIGSGLTSIGNAVFYNCFQLPVYNNIRYADTVLVEAVDKTLDSYIIDNSTKFISDYAFKDCAAITSITIPDGVISIGYEAFNNCTNLLDVTIPDSVISVSQYAFSNCGSLPVEDDLQYAGTYLIGTVSGINTYYEVRDGATWIGIGAFEGDTSIDTIVLPNTIKIIDSSAFAGLSTININIPYGVREIRSGAFDTNSSDENNTYLNVPETVIEIGGGAFDGIGTVVINKLYPWKEKIFGYHMDEWPNTRCVAFVNVDETTFAGDFNVSSLFDLGSMKDVRTYNIYTNNQTIIDQLIEASDDYTIFNISPLE